MKPKPKRKPRTAAVLTVYDAPKMTKKGREQIGRWLLRQADAIILNNKAMANRWTARYLY